MYIRNRAQFFAYAAARKEAAAAHLDPVEAAKYARAVARIALPVETATRLSVAALLDALDVPDAPIMDAATAAAIAADVAEAA